MSRLLITGAGGAVGSALSPLLIECCSSLVLVDREERGAWLGLPPLVRCDLESLSAVQRLVEKAEPDVLLHLAGNKDVFALEKSPKVAMRANVEITGHIVEALRGSTTFVIFLSTDYVFEGIAGPYRETSPTRPTTEYGRSKLSAEKLLLDSRLKVAIARSSSIFGFANDFVSQVRKVLGAGQPFHAYSDLVSNPTAVSDLYQMIRRIIDRRLAGTFHASGPEGVSRLDFSEKIAVAFGLDAGLVRVGQRDEHIRPPDLTLDNSATYAALGYRPGTLEESLRALAAR